MKKFVIFTFFLILTQILSQASNDTNNTTNITSNENITSQNQTANTIPQNKTQEKKVVQPPPKKVEDKKIKLDKNKPINTNNKNKNNTEKIKEKEDKNKIINGTKAENKKGEKPFNLTESLINFFIDTFGSKDKKDNNTNKDNNEEISNEEDRKRREQEMQKKLTEERNRKRKEEQEKNANLEKIKIENKKKQEKLKKFEEEHNNFVKILANNSFEEVIQINLEQGEKETLYIDLESFSKIKIAVMLSDNEEEEKINFFFSGPNARGRTAVIYQLYGKNFLFWEYETLRKGEYFAEIINKGTKMNEIYFLLNNQNKKKDVLNTEKLDKISMLLNNIDTNVNQLRNKKKIEIKQVNSHNEKVTNNNKWIVYYSIIEIVTMVMVFMIQSCYINSLVNKV